MNTKEKIAVGAGVVAGVAIVAGVIYEVRKPTSSGGGAGGILTLSTAPVSLMNNGPQAYTPHSPSKFMFTPPPATAPSDFLVQSVRIVAGPITDNGDGTYTWAGGQNGTMEIVWTGDHGGSYATTVLSIS